MKRFIGLGMAVFVLFTSCDILRFSLFEVSSWSPGGGYHADPESLEVSLSFSRDPDIASAEKHFSLSTDGEQVRGDFRWEGRKMYFTPFVPLEANREYSAGLSAAAHDKKGLSMDRDFEGRFTTREDSTRLRIESFTPEMEGIMDSSRKMRRRFFLSRFASLAAKQRVLQPVGVRRMVPRRRRPACRVYPVGTLAAGQAF